MSYYYYLRGTEVVKAENEMDWCKNFESQNKVGRTEFISETEEILVSTVFLGIDHSFSETGPPIVFETMIFRGEHDEYQERYSTWEEAVLGHEKACKIVSESLEKSVAWLEI